MHTDALNHLFIYSFVRSFVRTFVRSFTPSFIHFCQLCRGGGCRADDGFLLRVVRYDECDADDVQRGRMLRDLKKNIEATLLRSSIKSLNAIAKSS